MQGEPVAAGALQVGDQAAPDGGLDADAQHLTGLLQGDIGDFPQFQDLPRALEQFLAGDGQGHAALVAVEQHDVELALQLTDLS